jgi:hypothetical protein
MKNHLIFYFLTCSLIMLICSCTKPYTSGVDHTIGMSSGSRSWAGTSSGYFYGDTVIGGTHTNWPEYFNKTITDTAFAVQKIDGFTIKIGNTTMAYRSTDSVTTKSVTFDSLISGSLTASMKYYYAHDSMVLNYNGVFGFNSTANQYYQTNTVLHTK